MGYDGHVTVAAFFLLLLRQVSISLSAQSAGECFSLAARICTCTKPGCSSFVLPPSLARGPLLEKYSPTLIRMRISYRHPSFVRIHLASFPFLCVFSSPKGSLIMHPPPFSWGAEAEGSIEGHKKEDRAERVTGSVRDFSNRTKSLSLTALLCANSSPGFPSRFPHPEAVCLVLSPLRALFLPVSPVPPPPPKNEIQYPRLILLLPTKPKIEKPGNRHTQKNVRNRGEGR